MNRSLRLGVFAALLCGAIALAPSTTRADDATIVTLPSGAKLHGLVNTDRNMLEWRGIPFAEPPLGPLRWRPPVPTSWTGTREATAFGNHCVQPGDDGSSEDCLYLNVSVPLGTASGDLLPVMVDIHGGANTFGSAREDTGGWVKHGVIVVTMNYRLGALGAFAHPALTVEGGGTSSNYGMRDQIAALEWVRDNIAAFGGDKDNVTITGFSSGAGFVIALEASPVARGLFVRAIPSAFFWDMSTNQHKNLQEQEQWGELIAGEFGCPSPAEPDILACLRNLPAEELAPFWWDIGAGGAAGIVDGVLLPKTVLELIEENGSVPTLIGHAREEEGGIYFDPAIPDPMSPGEFTIYTNDVILPSFATRFRKFYTEAEYGSLRWAWIYYWTDISNTCPMRRVALVTGQPTYQYLSTHRPESDPYFQFARATHGSDMILIYDETWYEQTPAEAALSLQMTTYFTNFAKTGDPNRPEVPGLPVWEPFTAADEKYMEFADTSIPRTGGYHSAQCPIIDDAEVFPRCGTLCHWFEQKNMPAVLQKIFGFFRVNVCHDGETLEILGRHLDTHLAHGDEYGECIVRVSLPGRIEAENYAYGGEDTGYHDTDLGNNGGEYRIDDVDIRSTLDGSGFQVGWIDFGEWLSYDVFVTQTGLYTVTAQVASGCCDYEKSFHLELDGVAVGDPFRFDLTTSWDAMHDVVVTDVPLEAGEHELRVVMDVAPFDLDGFDFELQPPGP